MTHGTAAHARSAQTQSKRNVAGNGTVITGP